LLDEGAGLGVVEVDGARVGELGEAGLGLASALFSRSASAMADGDLFAAFFSVADGVDLDARAGGLKACGSSL